MKPFIIAEIGLNHNGDINIAKKLIDMAVDCGCNAVKFQKRDIDTVYTKTFLDSPRDSPWGITQREQKEGLEFGFKEYEQIDIYCFEKDIQWSASAWNFESLTFLEQFNLPFNKIASPMLTYTEFLRVVADEGRQTFISTGMSELYQIEEAVKIFQKAACPFTLMHCTSIYPCPDNLCNLRFIPTLKHHFGHPVGYSSHTASWEDCVLAVAQGAEVIEVHITMDRSMYGSDQPASLEKPGLERMVRECRKAQGYLGNGIKCVLPDELVNARKLRYWE